MRMSLEQFRKCDDHLAEFGHGCEEEVWSVRDGLTSEGNPIYKISVHSPRVPDDVGLVVIGTEKAYRTVEAISECMLATSSTDPFALAGLLIGTKVGILPEIGAWIVSHASPEGYLYGSIMRYSQCIASAC